jgi:hypothetical protein
MMNQQMEVAAHISNNHVMMVMNLLMAVMVVTMNQQMKVTEHISSNHMMMMMMMMMVMNQGAVDNSHPRAVANGHHMKVASSNHMMPHVV